jgi:aminopeptidase N
LGVFSEHPAITRRALELYESYKTDPATVPSELRSIVFGAAVRTPVAGAFDYLLELEEKTSNVDLKQELIGALTTTHSIEEGKRLLERLKDPVKVRQHDVDTWLVLLQRNRYTQELAWDWLRANWQWVEDTFSNDKSFDYFPRYSASSFNSRKLLEEYKEFYEPLMKWTQLKRNIQMGIEELESRVAWLERDVAAVNAFFRSIGQ